jgi:hypothetical protein
MGRVQRFQQLLRSWSDGPAAQRYRPARLPPIEPELRVPAPRPWVWVVPEHTPAWARELLRTGRAVRAWVYEHSAWQESDGPEVRARYAFEAEDGSLVFSPFSGSYDGYHFAMNTEFSAFIDRAVRLGGTFTVLHPPGRPEQHRLYGDLDARLYVPVVQLAQRLVALGPKASREREALREQLLVAFRSLVQRDYYDGMGRLLGATLHLERYDAYALEALEAVEQGRASAAALAWVEKKQRGRWTAT